MRYQAFDRRGGLIGDGEATLTSASAERLADALRALEGLAIDPWYGDMAVFTDGAALGLTMVAYGSVVETAFSPLPDDITLVQDDAPAELRALGTLILEVRQAIAECETDGLVEPDRLCALRDA